ncbi:MAG: class E sortase [Actinobacteria bacterium]|nr:class E sortase [Actinomycetota bacterium]
MIAPRYKKTKIIKISVIVLVICGILISIYPLYKNYKVARENYRALSLWEEQKKILPEDYYAIEATEKLDEEIGGSNGNDVNSVLVEESNVLSENLIKDIEYRTVGYGRKDYDYFNADNFFPLKISIQGIDLEWIVNEGTDTETLKKGPGHIVETSLPGNIGRCTISGHRTTYGSPFNRVDELEKGDLIYLETIRNDIFIYVVKGQIIVNPEDVYIIQGAGKRELLLTTCHPKYSEAKRLIIIAELINIYPFWLIF